MRSEIACETRAVPTASNGFIAAISRNCSPAGTRPSRGTWISPSASTPTSTFSVSSGTRLSSSMYSSAPSLTAVSSGPSTNVSAR